MHISKMMLDDWHSMDNLEIMKILFKEDQDAFMRILYRSLESFPERVKHDPHPLDQRISAITKVLKYFEQESIQEFEKCAFLKNLIDELKQD